MNVLVISRFSVHDRHAWSGITYKMVEAMEGVFEKVHYCDSLGYPRGSWIGLENRLLHFVGRNSYWRMRGAKYHSRQIKERMRLFDTSWDIAFAIDSLLSVGALKVAKPIVYLSDCTKSQLVELGYPGYMGISERNLRSIMEFERMAYQNCDLLIFGSNWACDAAVQRYGVAEQKVMAIPYGANLDAVPDRECALRGRPNADGKCRLLFLGVQWERKGGDIALAVANALNAHGLPTELTVCGCVPPCSEQSIRVVRRLDKKEVTDQRLLFELLSDADYLILPTRGDCSPIVFCEAFAHGLPVVSCAVGGVGEIVTNNVNGFVLSPNAPPEEFALSILENYRRRDVYLGFRRAARKAYEEKFNWECWASRIHEVAESLSKVAG
jgi:glycosyltransferase involved in cell wall biosynthesis